MTVSAMCLPYHFRLVENRVLHSTVERQYFLGFPTDLMGTDFGQGYVDVNAMSQCAVRKAAIQLATGDYRQGIGYKKVRRTGKARMRASPTFPGRCSHPWAHLVEVVAASRRCPAGTRACTRTDAAGSAADVAPCRLCSCSFHNFGISVLLFVFCLISQGLRRM